MGFSVFALIWAIYRVLAKLHCLRSYRHACTYTHVMRYVLHGYGHSAHHGSQVRYEQRVVYGPQV